MYSPLDSGPTVYPEIAVGDGREFLYLDGISATWHDVQSKDRQSDRRVTCQNSLILFASLDPLDAIPRGTRLSNHSCGVVGGPNGSFLSKHVHVCEI